MCSNLLGYTLTVPLKDMEEPTFRLLLGLPYGPLTQEFSEVINYVSESTRA